MPVIASVIVPLYNTRNYIRRCLDSLLQQDFVDFEILVVDDGSTDDSAEIVKSIKNDKIRLLTKSNGGLSSARNYGLRHCCATSKYVMFVDSDDAVDPKYISSMVEQLEDYNSDLAICAVHHCNDESYNTYNSTHCKPYKIENYINIWNNQNFLKQLPLGIINSVCTKCFKLSIICENNLAFYNTLPEDTLFNIAYLEHIKKVSQIEAPLYHYIHRLGTMSTKPNELIFKNYEKLQSHLFQIVDSNYHHYIYAFGYPHYLANTRAYIRCGDKKTPNIYLKKQIIRTSIQKHKSTCIGDYVVKVLLLFRQYNLLMKLS